MENKIEFSFRYLIPKVLYACLTSMTACDTADDKLLFEDKILIDKGASNINLEVKSGTDNVILASFLAFPSATPAKLKTVMVMHGSGGPWDDDDTNGDGIADLCHPGQLSNQSEAWKNLLIANGFAVVFVDSYSSRGTCPKMKEIIRSLRSSLRSAERLSAIAMHTMFSRCCQNSRGKIRNNLLSI